MILSKARRFVFVKGRKVASTSVEIALSTVCGPEDIVTPITPVDEKTRLERGGVPPQNTGADPAQLAAYAAAVRATPPEALGKLKAPKGQYYNHMPLAEVVARFGPIPADFRVVCIERCPYQKIVSWANMKIGMKAYKRGGEMRAKPGGLGKLLGVWSAITGQGRETETGRIRKVLDAAIRSRDILEVRNIDLYRGPDGAVAAEVLRYDRLAEDMERFFREIGVTAPPALPHVKKGIMAGDFRPEEFFSAQQIAVINDLFRDEFETFGFAMA